MDIWSWICELPYSDEWNESNSPLTFQLGSSSNNTTSHLIQLKAERLLEANSDAVLTVTFSVCYEQKTLWVSDACPLSSDKPFLPLILQLLQEIISRSPTAQGTGTCPLSQLQKLKPDPVAWILDSHSPESFSSFFNLVFLTRLFWLCLFDSPSEVGSLYFHSLLAPNLESFSCKHAPVLRAFFISVGTDVELCFMRTFGYMLAKWLLTREVGVGLQLVKPLPSHAPAGFSYAMESHGLWILKGYAPVLAMSSTRSSGLQYHAIETKESLLRYTLAHQQLEAVIQMEYTVAFNDGFIQVSARVDNLRFHVAKLGFKKSNDVENGYANEKHFPSRIRVWVGPEVGANYVTGLSLGRSTDNVEKEVEMQKSLKGKYEKSKVPTVKATTRTLTRSKMRNWRWDQDAEGNAAVFDLILCDNTTGVEVATWKPSDGGSGESQIRSGFRKRYTGASRSFTKSGSLVFGRDEGGESVVWRLSKEMEGSVLKWRIGGQVWASYWPNDIKSSYSETRCVEWCDEVDLPLIPPPNTNK